MSNQNQRELTINTEISQRQQLAERLLDAQATHVQLLQGNQLIDQDVLEKFRNRLAEDTIH